MIEKKGGSGEFIAGGHQCEGGGRSVARPRTMFRAIGTSRSPVKQTVKPPKPPATKKKEK